MKRLLHISTLLSLLLIIAVMLISGCETKKPHPTLPGAHADSWMDDTSVDFHGNVSLATGFSGCENCHGTDFSGGPSGVACSDCHGIGQQNCLSCHTRLQAHASFACTRNLRAYTLLCEVLDNTRLGVRLQTVEQLRAARKEAQETVGSQVELLSAVEVKRRSQILVSLNDTAQQLVFSHFLFTQPTACDRSFTALSRPGHYSNLPVGAVA